MTVALIMTVALMMLIGLLPQVGAGRISRFCQIRNLTELPEAPQGGGVRIATDPTAGGLTMSLAATPAEDDTVLDTDGARLFLDSTATTLLDDKTCLLYTSDAADE